jgi:hypothetical protein
VQGKQSRYYQTGQSEPSGSLQQKKQQHGIGGVKQETRVVVASRIEVEELVIQGMRHPGQWMPISIVEGRERPLHGSPRQTPLNMGVSQNIGLIVEIDELVTNNGVVESERGHDQQETVDG